MSGLDSLFPYPTQKIARIRDSRIGLLRYALMSLILIYVVGYQIMWRGNHLEMHDMAGVYEMQLDQPTRNSCNAMNVECMQNFTSLSQLSYCSQCPESGPIKLPCQYWDAHQLGQLTDGGLMIPTHVSTYYQTNGCKPSAANNWTCVGWVWDFLDKKGQVQSKPRGQASPANEVFVADVERFTVTIDHSVRSTLGHRYYASDMVGYVLDCDQDESDAHCVARPIACRHSKCKAQTLGENRATSESVLKFRGDRRSLSLAGTKAATSQKLRRSPDMNTLEPDIEDDEWDGREQNEHDDEADDVAALQLQKGEDRAGKGPTTPTPESSDAPHGAPGRAENIESLGVVSIAEGDMFSIGELLKAANVSLDRRRHHVPSWVGGTYRSSGFVLVIRVHYSNIESWLGAKVLPWNVFGPTMHYTYRITKHASHDDFMLSKVHAGGSTAPKHSRKLTEFHGIRVLIEQSGSVAVWDNIQLLLILTTTLALMAVSTCITDTIAMNCMPQSEEYSSIKFERPKKTQAKHRADAEDTSDHEIMRYSSQTV